MEVSFYATLRRVVGAKSIEVDLPAGATADDLLKEMIRRYPALRDEMLDEAGNLRQHVHVFVNGRDAPFLEGGLGGVLPPGARIGVFPAVAGG
jgi:molybdopterin synthase sulfur carrier subunit